MTDEEVIKALQYCEDCSANINIDIIDLIKRQKAEIEALYQINAKSEKEIYELRKRLLSRENLEESFNRSVRAFDKRLEKTVKLERAAAYKEFAERLKRFIIPQKADGYTREIILKIDIDNLLKEMVGE